MRAVIDTCVILDYLQGREPFFDDALGLAIGMANREFEGYITANSLTDINYIVHRQTHSSIETRKILTDLTLLFGLADTCAEDCINALHNGMKDFEDAVISETAYRIRADYIVTINERDCSGSKVPAVSPGEFLLKLDDQ